VDIGRDWTRCPLGDLSRRRGARGVSVPATVREQILACTDLAQLDTWLRRAVTATTAEDVIRA